MANYDEMSLEELRAAAAEQDIAGRSNMNKAELQEALGGTGDAPAAGDDTPAMLDGVDETEEARVEESAVDVEYPEGMPGPAPARSAPVDPNAKMSTVGES